jgi:hypothetical protein
MSAQRRLHELTVPLTTCVVVTSFTYKALEPSLSGIIALFCGLSSIMMLATVFASHSRTRSTTRMRSLLGSIHAQVSFLTSIGCHALVPKENSRAILHLLVRMEEDSAIIEEVGRNGVYYRYSIQEIGRVRRSMAGGGLTDADYQWRDDELTPVRLQMLLATLRGAYTPGRVLATP